MNETSPTTVGTEFDPRDYDLWEDLPEDQKGNYIPVTVDPDRNYSYDYEKNEHGGNDISTIYIPHGKDGFVNNSQYLRHSFHDIYDAHIDAENMEEVRNKKQSLMDLFPENPDLGTYAVENLNRYLVESLSSMRWSNLTQSFLEEVGTYAERLYRSPNQDQVNPVELRKLEINHRSHSIQRIKQLVYGLEFDDDPSEIYLDGKSYGWDNANEFFYRIYDEMLEPETYLSAHHELGNNAETATISEANALVRNGLKYTIACHEKIVSKIDELTALVDTGVLIEDTGLYRPENITLSFVDFMNAQHKVEKGEKYE